MREPLTKKQFKILELLLQGFTYNGIGLVLGVKPTTAKWHTTEIFSKYNVKTRSELMALYIDWEKVYEEREDDNRKPSTQMHFSGAQFDEGVSSH